METDGIMEISVDQHSQGSRERAPKSQPISDELLEPLIIVSRCVMAVAMMMAAFILTIVALYGWQVSMWTKGDVTVLEGSKGVVLFWYDTNLGRAYMEARYRDKGRWTTVNSIAR